jgi:hypothetical protein
MEAAFSAPSIHMRCWIGSTPWITTQTSLISSCLEKLVCAYAYPGDEERLVGEKDWVGLQKVVCVRMPLIKQLVWKGKSLHGFLTSFFISPAPPDVNDGDFYILKVYNFPFLYSIKKIGRNRLNHMEEKYCGLLLKARASADSWSVQQNMGCCFITRNRLLGTCLIGLHIADDIIS